jgi:hypothetical protein
MPLPGLAASASLAASTVVLTLAGALILLPELAIAAAALRLVFADKNMVLIPNIEIKVRF